MFSLGRGLGCDCTSKGAGAQARRCAGHPEIQKFPNIFGMFSRRYTFSHNVGNFWDEKPTIKHGVAWVGLGAKFLGLKFINHETEWTTNMSILTLNPSIKYSCNGSTPTHSQMSNKDYASMLNGMTKMQLKEEQASLKKQLDSLGISKWFTPEYKQLVERRGLVNQEIGSRKGLGADEDASRMQIQNTYEKKSTFELQSELSKLKTCRTIEQGVVDIFRNEGVKVQSQFDSNYGKDSELEKRIGVLEAELARRSASAKAPMSDKDYASMLNGMSKVQLQSMQTNLKQQMKSLGISKVFTPAYKQLQGRLNLVNQEMQSRKGAPAAEDASRAQIQNAYAKKPTSELRHELAKLKACRAIEQGVVDIFREKGVKVQSQFDSNYDKDSELEKRIGALQAELARR